MFQFSTVKSLLLSLTTYTVCILDQCDISNSNSTTSVVVAEVEKIELLEKNSKEGKTLEQLMFPELNYDSIDQVCGMDISIVTSSNTDQEGHALLKALGMPFKDGPVT